MKAPEVKAKKYIVVPRDALELLVNRFAEEDDAIEAAKDACAETGQAHYVVGIGAIATRETPPVKVKRL